MIALVPLAAAFALGTIGFGWWSVAAVAVVWGLINPRGQRAVLVGTSAAILATAALLGWTAVVGTLPLLAGKLGALAGIPGIAFVVLALALPGVLAATGVGTGQWAARLAEK